jgi:hypothetical protein
LCRDIFSGTGDISNEDASDIASERLIVACIGEVGLRGQFSVVAVPVKNHGRPRRALTRTIGGHDRHQYYAASAAATSKGGLVDCAVASWYALAEGGFWAVASGAYPTRAVRGRYRPTFIGTVIAAYIPWLIFPSGGRGPYDDGGRHCCHFGRWCCVNHGPSMVGASLDFRENANKRPNEKGVKPETEQIQQSTWQTGLLHCLQCT